MGGFCRPFIRGAGRAKYSWNSCSAYRTFAASQGNERILLNLDESYISFYYGGKAGFFVAQSAAQRHVEPPPSDSIGRKELCIGFIYIGLDGPNRIVQRELPHVMIIGAKDNSKRDHRVIQNGLPTSYQYLILVLKLNLEDLQMHRCLRAHIQRQSLLPSQMSI